MKLTWSFLIIVLTVAAAPAQTYNEPQAKAIAESYRLETNGDYAKAIGVLEAVKTNDYFFNLRLGWLYYLKTEYKTAVKLYQSAQSAKPRAVEARIGLMNCYYYSKEYTKTASAARDLQEFDPSNYSAMLYLVLVDMAHKDYSTAEVRANEALKMYPIDLNLNLDLAYIYLSQGRTDEARTVAKRLEVIYGQAYTEIAALKKALQ